MRGYVHAQVRQATLGLQLYTDTFELVGGGTAWEMLHQEALQPLVQTLHFQLVGRLLVTVQQIDHFPTSDRHSAIFSNVQFTETHIADADVDAKDCTSHSFTMKPQKSDERPKKTNVPRGLSLFFYTESKGFFFLEKNMSEKKKGSDGPGPNTNSL